MGLVTIKIVLIREPIHLLHMKTNWYVELIGITVVIANAARRNIPRINTFRPRSVRTSGPGSASIRMMRSPALCRRSCNSVSVN